MQVKAPCLRDEAANDNKQPLYLLSDMCWPERVCCCLLLGSSKAQPDKVARCGTRLLLSMYAGGVRVAQVSQAQQPPPPPPSPRGGLTHPPNQRFGNLQSTDVPVPLYSMSRRVLLLSCMYQVPLGPHSDLFRMLSPNSVKQIPVRTSLHSSTINPTIPPKIISQASA